MLPFASLLLLGMAIVMAVLVAKASRSLLRVERTARADTGAIAPHGRARRAMGWWMRTVHSLEERVAPGSALGLQLTISVLLALAALWMFVQVTDNIIDQESLSRFDAQVLVLLAPWRTDTGLAIASVVSRFGTVPVMSGLALLLVLFVYRRQWRAVVVAWTLVMLGGKLVEDVLKHTFHRHRPIGALHYLNGASYSYPSGHSMGSMIGYGMLAYLILIRVRRPPLRAAVTAGAALIILVIGLSRLVLAVHFFTDVVGGYAAGAVWLALSIAAVEAARERAAIAANDPERHRPA
jgi:membrane-associated phospholipid phosphatase